MCITSVSIARVSGIVTHRDAQEIGVEPRFLGHPVRVFNKCRFDPYSPPSDALRRVQHAVPDFDVQRSLAAAAVTRKGVEAPADNFTNLGEAQVFDHFFYSCLHCRVPELPCGAPRSACDPLSRTWPYKFTGR